MSPTIARAAFLALALTLAAGKAWADPCRAIPDQGPAPNWISPGSSFSGRVNYVGDGDSLCVATEAWPSSWVEVRLADFYAPELSEPGGQAAKRALERIALGRHVVCVAGRQTFDRVAATCHLRGRGLGRLLREAGAPEGGRGRR